MISRLLFSALALALVLLMVLLLYSTQMHRRKPRECSHMMFISP